MVNKKFIVESTWNNNGFMGNVWQYEFHPDTGEYIIKDSREACEVEIRNIVRAENEVNKEYQEQLKEDGIEPPINHPFNKLFRISIIYV